MRLPKQYKCLPEAIYVALLLAQSSHSKPSCRMESVRMFERFYREAASGVTSECSPTKGTLPARWPIITSELKGYKDNKK